MDSRHPGGSPSKAQARTDAIRGARPASLPRRDTHTFFLTGGPQASRRPGPGRHDARALAPVQRRLCAYSAPTQLLRLCSWIHRASIAPRVSPSLSPLSESAALACRARQAILARMLPPRCRLIACVLRRSAWRTSVAASSHASDCRTNTSWPEREWSSSSARPSILSQRSICTNMPVSSTLNLKTGNRVTTPIRAH